jgi:hypothetical protein
MGHGSIGDGEMKEANKDAKVNVFDEVLKSIAGMLVEWRKELSKKNLTPEKRKLFEDDVRMLIEFRKEMPPELEKLWCVSAARYAANSGK